MSPPQQLVQIQNNFKEMFLKIEISLNVRRLFSHMPIHHLMCQVSGEQFRALGSSCLNFNLERFSNWVFQSGLEKI